MNRFRAAPVAELLVFDLTLNLFLVLICIIIPPLADGATKSDQTVGALYFSHGENNTIAPAINQLHSPAAPFS